ncbi:hypothetical protein [Streptomyces sp. NPDC017991]|uniref:hypothetical protein n=1 Tax=Streptomyces sp. NPDC017991 TaxID=3365026 RepID=UPI003788DC40
MGRAALKIMWTYDTAVDDGPSAAGRRTADGHWLTPKYAAQLRSGRAAAVGDAQWREWTSHRAYTTVALKAADDGARPADTATEAWRQWAVTDTPYGRDHWKGEPTGFAAYVQLTRTGPGRSWQVTRVIVQ